MYIYIYVFHNPLAFYNVCIDKALYEKFTYTRKKVFSHNHWQNVWDKLYTSEIANYGKSSISIFPKFLLALIKFSFWEEDWAPGYNSIQFWYFLDTSLFPKILSLKKFGNSRGNSYIPCLLMIIIRIRFIFGEINIW